MFTRLEAREILRNLGSDCDEEVVDKLRAIAQSSGKQQSVPLSFVPAPPITQDVLAAMQRDEYRHLTDREYEALQSARLAGIKQDAQKATQIPSEAMAPAAIPPQYGIERIEKGGRNSVGDTCLGISADGFSIFACSHGHGYLANNPAVRGCGLCALQGNAQSNREETVAPTPRPSVDLGADVDSNW